MSSDPRWGDDARDNSWEHAQRDRESRERDRDSNDPRDACMRHVDLPRGPDRETVRDRDREYTLRGSETRTLATVGAFRVVPNSQLRDHDNAPAHDRSADIRHLRDQGLIETVRVPGHRDSVVVLTRQGRELLEGRADATGCQSTHAADCLVTSSSRLSQRLSCRGRRTRPFVRGSGRCTAFRSLRSRAYPSKSLFLAGHCSSRRGPAIAPRGSQTSRHSSL